MNRLWVCGMPAALLFLAFLPPPSAAQETSGSSEFVMPLRADHIVEDAANNSVVVRGRIDWPDGRRTDSLQVHCSGAKRALAVIDRPWHGLHGPLGPFKIVSYWSVDADFCKSITRSVQQRN